MGDANPVATVRVTDCVTEEVINTDIVTEAVDFPVTTVRVTD